MSFQIHVAILVALCSLQIVSAEYRFKVRGPPTPPRPPPVPQYAKKWQHQHQHPSRSQPNRHRPIPVHMPPSYKIPMGIPQGPRPVAQPVRNFWKNTQSKTNFRVQPSEKPFLSSPAVKAQEFDYHLQTNNIPTHAIPIKQVGEKGPIHTIPAPNLSLADKPIVVEEVRSEKQHQQFHTASLQQNRPEFQQKQQQQQQQHLHQYQVTESNEPNAGKLYGGLDGYYTVNQDLSGLQAQTSVHKAEAAAMLNLNLPQGSNFNQEGVYKGQQIPEQQIPGNDAYQFLNVYTQPHQQILDSLKLTDMQQLQLQQHYLQQHQQEQKLQLQQQPLSTYKTPGNPEVSDKQEQEFYEQIQQLRQESQNIQPEYHSFNYEEQHQKNKQTQDVSSLVTADYSLEPAADSSEIVHATLARNPNEALAQAQYIQQYFDTRTDSTSDNIVEPDVKTKQTQESDSDQTQSDIITSAFFATLPSRQAAEALASLQAAGKINSKNRNQQDVSNDQQQPSTHIYIQESNSSVNGEKKTENLPDYSENFDTEYASENSKETQFENHTQENNEQGQEQSQNENVSVSFGNRIKAKRS